MSLFSQTTLVLMLLFSASILKKIYPSQIDSNLKSVYWLLLTLMPIGSIMILVLLYTVTVDCWQCTIIAGILLTFNLCTIYIYASAVNSMEAQKQTEALQLMNDSYHAQLETLRFSQTKVHALQHDMKNHVLAMQSLFHSRQESELEAYFNRFQDELKWDKQWVKTGEIAIDSFLNYKLLQIEKLGTNISCKTLVENLSGFDLFDLCAILSNLLDNAYKALSCTNHRALRLDMKTEKMVLYITLYNTSDKKMIQKNGHFISDKRNTQSHGYGLRNVQNLSEKYHGIFHLASSGDGVTAQLMLYPQLKM